MNNSLSNIKSLIGYLPKKDAQLGYKFLENRDFQSLKELIDSAIYKVKAHNMQYRMGLVESSDDTDLDKLEILKAETDLYISYLDIPIDDDDSEIEEDLDLY